MDIKQMLNDFIDFGSSLSEEVRYQEVKMSERSMNRRLEYYGKE